MIQELGKNGYKRSAASFKELSYSLAVDAIIEGNLIKILLRRSYDCKLLINWRETIANK
jgi:hypothetical protein